VIRELVILELRLPRILRLEIVGRATNENPFAVELIAKHRRVNSLLALIYTKRKNKR
jgi:hypothetical protein